ncbi:MAG: glycosyl hydrolase family 88 [Clostridiaceae bacterium]|jgi:unsaturated rhamnogalacturonyl hydrolase|nr:glycosyl hydrolase family 88 [Clostridiaceae bacterium]
MMNSKGNAWSEKMAQSYMKSNPDLYERWSHEYGVIFKAMERLWRRTGNRMYFNYIQRNIDKNINESGKIVRGYQVEEFKVDAINSGKALFALFEITGDIRYKKVILTLADQLRIQPRTKEGVFWHKLVYPYQIFLDGFYMWAPFYAEYAEKFNESTIFDDIANQIIVAATHTKDVNTGLHYQAWDEKKEIFWCNKQTGCSHSFWSRTNGWFSMAMIDVLDFFPETHVKRNKIVEIFKNQIEGLIKVQDPGTGLWYQVLDKGDRKENYLETSGSNMFIYSIAKGIRKGYLNKSLLTVLNKAYNGLLTHMVETDDSGMISIKGTCKSASLGDAPHKDSTFEYYVSEPAVADDIKGIGTFILASNEVELLA